MTSEDLPRFVEVPPFEPFVAHLADGQEIIVPHREMVSAGCFGLSVRLLLDSGQVEVVDGALICSMRAIHASDKPFP